MFSGRVGPFFLMFLFFLAQNSLTYLFMDHLPSLMSIGVIYYSLKRGVRFGTALALFAGTLMEIFGQGGLGFYMVQFTAVAVLSGFVSSKIFQESLLAEIFLPVTAAYFCALSEIVYLQIKAGEPAGAECFAAAFQPWILGGTVILSPILFHWLQRVSRGRTDAWRR